jgi:hypothetical protein
VGAGVWEAIGSLDGGMVGRRVGLVVGATDNGKVGSELGTTVCVPVGGAPVGVFEGEVVSL